MLGWYTASLLFVLVCAPIVAWENNEVSHLDSAIQNMDECRWNV